MVSSPPRLAALLWDVDGTLAETERGGHRVAFNRVFEACGLPHQKSGAEFVVPLRLEARDASGVDRTLERVDRLAAVEHPEQLAAERVVDEVIGQEHGSQQLAELYERRAPRRFFARDRSRQAPPAQECRLPLVYVVPSRRTTIDPPERTPTSA